MHSAPGKVQGGFLGHTVVAQRAAVLQLFAGKDEALLILGSVLLVRVVGVTVC